MHHNAVRVVGDDRFHVVCGSPGSTANVPSGARTSIEHVFATGMSSTRETAAVIALMRRPELTRSRVTELLETEGSAQEALDSLGSGDGRPVRRR